MINKSTEAALIGSDEKKITISFAFSGTHIKKSRSHYVCQQAYLLFVGYKPRDTEDNVTY